MKKEQDYRDLIIKFLAGESSDDEINKLKKWLEEDQANRIVFDKENELWQESSFKTKQDHFKTDNAWNTIANELEIGRNKGNDVIIVNRQNFKILLVAASIACLVAVGGITLWITRAHSLKTAPLAKTTITTQEGEKAEILLSDSTSVFINSGSILEYSSNFNLKDRRIKFSGEAFFNVHTNPSKPLVVQLKKMTVVAKGTRFNILSYENEDRLEATLEEGNIQVAIAGKEPIDIGVGQQVVYFTKSDKILVRNIPTETYTSWRENKLRFNDTPFEEVLRRIGRRYNVVFEIKNKDLLELKYTATFIDESIEEIMEMLKTVSPINYKIYNRTKIDDEKYLKPKIVIENRKRSSPKKS